ncbi:hypothetical protein GIB67_019482 [Kingdonia uniflora]|uniref:Uncharacterized protein n=1 Tax=Kingdonia uniflora TaxID=39325 RepID=A0A7J7N0L5_9MAGN|nr:hypothetical protein GIB67_019482 [Kingdonia uniflora]
MLQRPRRRPEGAAMGAIVLDLRPGLGIGSFTIGMPICEAFAQIEQQPNIYDVVHVKYLDEIFEFLFACDMVPKSRVGTKRPRYNSTVILDGQRVGDNPVHWSTEKGFKDRPIVKEQIVDIKNVSEVSAGYAGVFAKFKAKGWTKILTPTRNVYPQIVRLFYASLQVESTRSLHNQTFFVTIDGAEYSEPLKLDIVISFPDHGFHLRFDPWSQRLRLIEVFDVKRLQMRYGKFLIGGPTTLATFVAVYALFGPTFPGIYDKDRGVYTLFYPGLSFAFPIPSQYMDCCHDEEAELPLEFPDGTTPVTCRVSIYDKNVDSKVGVGSLMNKATIPPLAAGDTYMEEVHAKLGEELWFSVGGQHIPFGASPQDVWTDLGRPCGIHQKQVDQMVIHSASDPRPRTTLCADYFYNYFTRGLDILFDGQTHRIKKFVLHTNFPGHADFNSYKKCNFFIYGSDAGFGQFHEGNPPKHCITTSTKFEQVKEILGDCGPAAIQTQGSTNNPFGSTFVYGYQNVAFEVMKNGFIATVTLFQS